MDVKFNLKAITGFQMGDFLEAVGSNNIKAMADTLAIVVTECPAEWGDPSKPETFGNLPFYGEFQDVINAMTEESKKYTS